MKLDHLYRALRTSLVLLAGALVMACGENNPEPDPEPEIVVDISCQDVFSSGLRVEAEPQGGIFTKDILFTTTDKWVASIAGEGTNGWISIEPSSGVAGKATMTVSVTDNVSESERRAEVTISCGNVSKSFVVEQNGRIAVVLDLSSLGKDKFEIVSLTDDNVMSVRASEDALPKVNDYICSGITDQFPYGFFYRVDAIEASSRATRLGELLLYDLKVSQVTLQVILGLMDKSIGGKWLDFYDVEVDEEEYYAETGAHIEKDEDDGYKIVDKTINLSKDFLEEKDESFKIEGSVSVLLKLLPKRFSAYFYVDGRDAIIGQDIELSSIFTTTWDVKGTISKKVKLIPKDTVPLKPITVWVGFPLILTPELTLEPLNVNGKIEAEFKSSYTKKYNFGVAYYFDLNRISFSPLDEHPEYFFWKQIEDPVDDATRSLTLKGSVGLETVLKANVGVYGSNKTLDMRVNLLTIEATGKLENKLSASLGIEEDLSGAPETYSVEDKCALTTELKTEAKVIYLKVKDKNEKELVSLETKIPEKSWGKLNWFEEFLYTKTLFYPEFGSTDVTFTNRSPAEVRIKTKKYKPFFKRVFTESSRGILIYKGNTLITKIESDVAPDDGRKPQQLEFIVPDDFERNVRYYVYPYTFGATFLFERPGTVVRNPVSFIIDDEGHLVSTTIDDVPGTNL